ncbi:MAG: hypothetical protein ACRDIV_11055 [Ktedonobacteraceae bacterium]
MTEEDTFPVIDQETLQPEQATWLLRRQHALQSDVPAVMKELDLTMMLQTVGTVRQVGSSDLGLMTWRDIDLAVSSPGLSIERAFEVMHTAYTHPMVKRVHYANESGSFNPTGLPRDERYYFGVYYDTRTHGDWKIDISFWLAEGIHPQPVHDAVKQQLTPETRLAILWIKDIWCRLPVYRMEVYSTDIYDAVFQHGVRTPGEFNKYLARPGKPTQ